MANTIKNFLVGVGYKYDEEGQQRIGSGLDSIRSKALKVGAVVAGGFGLKALTADFAASADAMGKFSEAYDLDPMEVSAFGDALRHSGGSVESMIGQLQQLAEMRAGLMVGDTGWLEQVGKAQIDPNVITDAENATDAYLALANVFQNMSTDERINAANALGFDQASMLLLSQGRDEVESLVQEMARIRPVTGDMTEMAAEFNDRLQDAKSNVGAIADEISVALLPVVNEVLRDINEWFKGDDIQSVVQVIQTAGEWLGDEDNTDLVKTGATAVGAMMVGAPTIPTVVGAGAYELWDWNADDVRENMGIDLPEWMFKPLGELFSGSDESESNDDSNQSPWVVESESNDDSNQSPWVVESESSVQPGSTVEAWQPPTVEEIFMTNMNESNVVNETNMTNVTNQKNEQSTPIKVEASFSLDGNVIDRKIIEVNERQNKTTAQSFETNVEG